MRQSDWRRGQHQWLLPWQYHSRGPSEPGWNRDLEFLAGSQPRQLYRRKRQLVCRRSAYPAPAQRYSRPGLQSDIQATIDVPPAELRVPRAATARWRHQPDAKVLRPSEPDQLLEPRLDD